MITITRTGSIADVIAQARDVPARVIPYAAATALTRTIKAAQAAVVAEMPRVFDRPVRYTLNATRIEPATKDNLSARIAVKHQPGTGTRPESYLLPEVDGGSRGEKRMERALRYEGVLRRGLRAMPGTAMQLDSAGNISSSSIRSVLQALKAVKAASATRGRDGRKLRKGRQLKNDLFVGQPLGGNRPDGIWRREGRRLRPLIVFTRAPQYRRRLDFEGIVAPVVLERFRAEFEAAAASIIARRR